jgi:hypothetical protein
MKVSRIVSGALLGAALTGAAAPALAGQWVYGPGGAYYQRGERISPGGAAALGVLGGLAVGAMVGSAAVAPAPVVRERVIVEREEECHVERAREYVPGWGWQVRKRTVCE